MEEVVSQKSLEKPVIVFVDTKTKMAKIKKYCVAKNTPFY